MRYWLLESQRPRWRSDHVLWRIVVESTGETASIGTSLVHTQYDLTDRRQYAEWLNHVSRIVLSRFIPGIRRKGWAERLVAQMDVQVIAISSLGRGGDE